MTRISTSHDWSRRRFLRAAGALSGSAFVVRHTPATMLQAFQANPLEERRAQAAAQLIVTTKLTDSVALLSGPGGNVVVLHGRDGLIVVDGFVKPAWPKLQAALAAVNPAPIKSMIDTHWHFDHADNNGNFRAEGAGVIAHENTKRRLMQSHDLVGVHFDPVPSAELPTQTFAAGLTLNANGEQTDLRHVPPAHTDTDIFVHFPKANVLHMGDVFFNGFYPFIDASTGGTIDGVIDASNTALNMVDGRTKVVPGHGPLGSRATLEAYVHTLSSVRDKVRAAKRQGKSLAEVQASRPSAEFDEAWGKGMLSPSDFIAIVYNTTR